MRSYLPTIAGKSIAHQNSTVWSFGKFLPALGDLPISQVKRPQLQKFFDSLTIASKSDIRADLHAVMQLALADELITANPVQFVKLPKKHRKPKQSFTAEELAKLIVASRGMVCHNAIVLACMGICRGESLGVKWPLTDSVTVVTQGEGTDLKNENRYRTVPIPDGLLAELEGRKQGYVVKCRDLGNITGMKANPAKKVRSRGFHRVKELAGLTCERTFHDIRHSVSTLLVRHGCHVFIKDAILGHVKQSMSAHYTDLETFEDIMKKHLDAVWGDISQHLIGVADWGMEGGNVA